jgi:hypothetical protein
MQVKQTIKKITPSLRVPFDREIVKYLGEFLGRSITNKVPEEDEKKLTYSIQKNDRVQLAYEFNKEIIGKIKNQLSIKEEPTQLNVGRLAGKMWLSLIVLAYEQGQDDFIIRGTFKYNDITRLWGVKNGGKVYGDIRNLFISLSSAKFIQKTQAGNEVKVNFYSLINSGSIIEKKDEKDSTTFSYTLNDQALGLTQDWIRWGKLSKSRQEEGYLSIPLRELKENIKDVNYLNFRERLRLFGGGVIGGEIVLQEWLKLDDDKLLRRGYCYKTITNCLIKAKQDRELKDYEVHLPLKKGWQKIWKVRISK